MNLEQLRAWCLGKPGVTESFPFDEHTLVFKVGGKVFLLASIGPNEAFTMNVKCDPETAIDLRERYPDIVPGYHMNKKHWNTLSLEGALSYALLTEQMENSYWLVRNSLPKKVQQELDLEKEL